MKRLKIITIPLTIVLLFMAPMAKVAAYSNPFCDKTDSSGTCTSGLCARAPDSAVCKDSAKQQGTSTNPVTDTIKKVANVIAIIAGIASVIIIIISGFMFITAGGSIAGQRAGDNPAKAAKAKSALSAALVGLVIVALAWTIVTFITDKFIH
jgi:hypothetical protein